MLPLQIFFNALDWLRAPDRPHLLPDDPFAQSQIAAMTERQLADLPLPRPDRQAAEATTPELPAAPNRQAAASFSVSRAR